MKPTFLSMGAGTGIGYATAEHFARQGFDIVLASRRTDNIWPLVEQLASQGFTARAQAFDAGDPKSVAALVNDVSQSSRIDVLHYNVASKRFSESTLEKQPADTFNTDLAVNVGGALAAIQAVSPIMVQQSGGTVLITGGGLALHPTADHLSLSIGKVALRAMTQALFEPLRAKGIHVASVQVMGFVDPGSQAVKGEGRGTGVLEPACPATGAVDAGNGIPSVIGASHVRFVQDAPAVLRRYWRSSS